MSPRTGRPTKEPKEKRESFRFSDKDIEKLDFCAKQNGTSKTEIIRKGIDLVYQETTKK